MAKDAARAIVQAHEPELVEWATTTLARKLKTKEKVENPAGWLRKAIEEDWRPQPTLFAQEHAKARDEERKAEREQLDQQVKTAEGRKVDTAHEKAVIMGYVNSLLAEEREELERSFREYLVERVPPVVAKRFAGGETWCADLIIRTAASAYLKTTRI